MTWADWIIVGVLIAAVLGGLAQGFVRSFCSLAGLICGLEIAAWNYARVAAIFLPIVRIEAVANTIAFVLIALLIMALANVIGGVLSKTVSGLGLGCLDSFLGALFGFFQGAVLVMIGVLITVAFFPHTQWLLKAKLPQYFFAASHMTMHVGPSELSDRLREGLRIVQEDTQKLLHSGHGKS